MGNSSLFDSYQCQQFFIAKQYGIGNSEITKHPEWDGLFMNLVVNREKEGGNLSSCYMAADWLSNNLTTKAKNTGKIGENYGITISLINLTDKGVTPKPFGDIPEDKETACKFALLEQLRKYDKALKQKSGRYSIRDLCIDDIQLLLSEGLSDVSNLLSQMQSVS